MAAPQDHVIADHAGHEIDDLAVLRQLEEAPAAAHAFAVVAFDVGRHQLLGPHAGVVADQFVERLAHRRDPRLGQPELRDHPAFGLVLRDLSCGQLRHVCTSWRPTLWAVQPP